MCFQRVASAVLLSILTVTWCAGQQLGRKLTNQDVIDMVSLGISDDVIIEKIHASDANSFDTSVASLKALKAAKVSDSVIRAMINPHPEVEAATKAPPGIAPKMDAKGLPEDAGVYIVVKGRLAEIEPELVGWQTGGVVKKVATLGLDKGHVNGKVMNPKSPLQVPNPIELIIKTPEGTAATEYQLLHFYVKENRREFRAVTGGVLHSTGGAERNAVSFEPQKVAARVWRVKLKDVPKGEYGFLPPGVNSQSLSSSGKIYTFGVVE